LSRYLALEGVDGSGKSTISAALAERLRARGDEVVVVREPGGTALGEVVRGLLLDSGSVEPWAEVMLFAAQRAQLAGEVIRPALERGAWVISDRSYYSSITYQGLARGLGIETVRGINETGLDGTLPDHVIVIDVDPAVGLDRQDRADRIGAEGLAFQQEVSRGYHDLARAEPDVVSVVDGTLPVDAIVDRIMELIG
jgi:dTMP kinase